MEHLRSCTDVNGKTNIYCISTVYIYVERERERDNVYRSEGWGVGVSPPPPRPTPPHHPDCGVSQHDLHASQHDCGKQDMAERLPFLFHLGVNIDVRSTAADPFKRIYTICYALVLCLQTLLKKT